MTIAIAWASFLIGALVGAFWAGRARDDRESYEPPVHEYELPRDDAVQRLINRSKS